MNSLLNFAFNAINCTNSIRRAKLDSLDCEICKYIHMYIHITFLNNFQLKSLTHIVFSFLLLSVLSPPSLARFLLIYLLLIYFLSLYIIYKLSSSSLYLSYVSLIIYLLLCEARFVDEYFYLPIALLFAFPFLFSHNFSSSRVLLHFILFLLVISRLPLFLRFSSFSTYSLSHPLSLLLRFFF